MKTAILLVLSLGGMNYPQMVTNVKVAVKKVRSAAHKTAKTAKKAVTGVH